MKVLKCLQTVRRLRLYYLSDISHLIVLGERPAYPSSGAMFSLEACSVGGHRRR